MKKLLLGILVLSLAGCGQTPAPPGMKLGAPYEVDGKTYYPDYDPTYDKIGEASWYGPGFHGKYTANGERFNQYDLTAAHPTLPMPCLVRVTNLTNGKSLIVRVNDRGPFKSNRIIDLSKGSAQKLGIKSTTKVRVQYLKAETDAYIASLQSGGKQVIDMAQVNDNVEIAKNDSVLHSTEPQSQIVEAIDSTPKPGDTVTEAAPVETVASSELPKPPAAPKSIHLIQQAFADDNVSDSQPVVLSNDDKPRVNPWHAPDAPKSSKTQLVKTESVAAVDANGKYYIQAGSFSSEDNAKKLSLSLKTISGVEVGKVEMGEKLWWRVRVGPFADEASATEALERVRGNGAPDARIVRL